MFTNGSASGQYLMRYITAIKKFDSVIVEMKYKNNFEKFIQKLLGYPRYNDFKNMFELIKTDLGRRIYKIEKSHTRFLKNLLKKEKLSTYTGHVLKVGNINDFEIVEYLKKTRPDIVIVFGTSIIKNEILSLPIKFINIHFSILPYYRGSKPEFWQFFNKDYDKVGITLHIIEKNVDTGPILCQAHTHVNTDDNYITIRYKNLKTAVDLVKNNLQKIETNLIAPNPQNLDNVKTYNFKMFSHDIRYNYWKGNSKIL